MANAIGLGTQAWEENTALTREAELRYGTMASRLQFAKNRLNDMAITIGNVLAPILVDFVDKLEPFIETIADFVRDNPQVVKWLAALAGALVGIGGGLLVIGGALKGASILLGALQGIGGLIGIIAGIGLGPLLAYYRRTRGRRIADNQVLGRNQSVLFGILGRVLSRNGRDKRCVCTRERRNHARC